jgi:glycerol uptake facilitator-like aquaporin
VQELLVAIALAHLEQAKAEVQDSFVAQIVGAILAALMAYALFDEKNEKKPSASAS